MAAWWSSNLNLGSFWHFVSLNWNNNHIIITHWTYQCVLLSILCPSLLLVFCWISVRAVCVVVSHVSVIPILFWHSSIIITFGLSVIVTLSCRLFLWMLWIFSDNLHTNYITFIIWGCVDDGLSSSSSRQEFNTSGSSNTDTGKASGSLETKYKMKELGLSFNQKWNTDNTLATEVTVEDQVRVGASPVHTCSCSW